MITSDYWKRVENIYSFILPVCERLFKKYVKRNTSEEAIDILHNVLLKVEKADLVNPVLDLKGYVYTSYRFALLEVVKKNKKFVDKYDMQFTAEDESIFSIDDINLATVFIDSLINLPFKYVPQLEKGLFLSYFINAGNDTSKWGKSFSELSVDANMWKPVVIKKVHNLLQYLSYYFLNSYYIKNMKYELRNPLLVDEGNLILKAKYGYSVDFNQFIKVTKTLLGEELKVSDKSNKKKLAPLIEEMFQYLFIEVEGDKEIINSDKLTELYESKGETSYTKDSAKESKRKGSINNKTSKNSK